MAFFFFFASPRSRFAWRHRKEIVQRSGGGGEGLLFCEKLGKYNAMHEPVYRRALARMNERQ